MSTLPGCLHNYKAIDIVVTDAETKQPIANAETQIGYLRMPLIYDFGPAFSEGRTDSQGRVQLRCVTDEFPWISVKANDHMEYEEHFTPTSLIIQTMGKGGHLQLAVPLFKGKGSRVELIAPDGFRGLVYVEVQALDEKDWIPGQRRFSANISRGGVVEFKAPAPLLLTREGQFHTEFEVRYANGERIHRYGHDDNDIGWRFLYCDTGLWFFVIGTKEDLEAARETIYQRVDGLSWTYDRDATESWIKRQKAIK